MSEELKQAAQAALEALEEIALAGMSGTGQESEEGLRDWHARQAWKFIGIAARELEPLRRALTQRPAAQTEREADGLPLIVAGAIFDFAGFMTTRSEVIEVGSTADAGPVADLVKEWAELRGLDLADAAVLSWQLHITRASLPAPQQATPAQEPCQHVLYETTDADRPTEICDRNGEVVLAMCKLCRKAEVELEDAQQATPEPVGEVVAWQRRDRNIVTGEWSEWHEDDDIEEELDPEWAERRQLFTRPAPGVPEGFALVPVEPTEEMTTAVEHAMWDKPSVKGADVWSAVLAAAQAKGGQ